MSFGELLRELRTNAELTQEELGQAAGLSTRTVSDLERGISLAARKDTARLLADALRLTGRDRAAFEAAARRRGIADGVAAATRTLPRDVISFVDRAGELRQVAAAAGTGGICAIGGMPGVGKTAFAVRAAHQLAPLYPDGQICLPLHAHSAGRVPVQPADALASLLQTIGISPARIPQSLEARTSLWRDRLADRRLLLLLDDAAGTDQVLPLLPGTGGILVLITSRTHLTALDDAQVISLSTLQSRDACDLLARFAVRPGLDPADPDVAGIARLCGGLPLALGLVARQLYHHPAWSPAAVAADLAGARDRLELMHAENLSVAAAFDRSYQDLTASEQRMFRQLALHPGSDFDAPAAGALADVSTDEARKGLEGLYDHYLLAEITQGRYRFHELIREHARRLVASDFASERDTATTRLLDYYLRAARAAGQHLRRSTAHITSEPVLPAPGETAEFGSREEALSWMSAERLNLHAAARLAVSAGLFGHAAAIPAAMHDFLRSQGHWQQAMTLHRLALEAAGKTGSRPAEAGALVNLGDMQFLTDDYPAATANLTRALDLYRTLGDQPGQASALTELGAVQHATGDNPAATTSLTTALSLDESLGDQPGLAAVLTELGAVQHATGDNSAAAASLTTALSLYDDLGDQPGLAAVLTELGTVQYVLGDHDLAAASQQRALDLFRCLGDRLGQAAALTSLGAVQCLTGRYEQAEASHTRALGLYRDLDDRSGEAEALNNMADTIRMSAMPARACPYYDRALALATRIAAHGQRARALEGIGLCRTSEGDHQHGRELLQQAAAVYRRIGSPRARDIEHLLTSPAICASCSPLAAPEP